MNLLKLAKDAKDRVTGRDKWTVYTRHDTNDNGGEAVCLLGAIESSLGLEDGGAEYHPLAQKLIEKMAVLVGWPTYEKAKREYDRSSGGMFLDREEYISDCANTLMSYNDNGTQRRVQNLFRRVIFLLEKTKKPKKKNLGEKFLGLPMPLIKNKQLSH